MLNDAQCLTDEQQAKAAEQLAAYTTALQTDLTTAGYDPGPIDGVYGPTTVAAVRATPEGQRPARDRVRRRGHRRARCRTSSTTVGQQQALQTVMLQTILSLVGFWDGPIDGVWTDELTQALKDFQTALGVEPTGVVDAATIAAFQQALANLEAGDADDHRRPRRTADRRTDEPADRDHCRACRRRVATVVVADSDLGQILTAADGMTVYLFMPDAQGAPTCTDACAAVVAAVDRRRRQQGHRR